MILKYVKKVTLYQQIEGSVSCIVSDAALVLSKYLETVSEFRSKWLQGLNVIELEAGVGCVGLITTCLGTIVIMTDLLSVLPLLNLNIKKNTSYWISHNGTAKAHALSWGSSLKLDNMVDIILLAECIYYEEAIKPLVNTLRMLLESKSQLLSQELCESKTNHCGNNFGSL